MKSILFLVDSVINIYIWLIIINVILSWLVAFNVLNTQNKFGASSSKNKFLIKNNNKIRTTGEISIEPKLGINLLILFRTGSVNW